MRGEGLSDYAATCRHCGATIWLYGTPDGHKVALDDSPGPYLIVGTKAYRSTGAGGFRGHWDYCRHIAVSSIRIDVIDAEFLWR